MPGRGTWLHPRRHCLENARRRRAFDRALRGRFTYDDLLDQQIEAIERSSIATHDRADNGHDPGKRVGS